MSWERALLSLYEQNADQAGCITYKEYESKGKTVRIPNVLLPVYHTTAAAQIEVTIDEEGNFLGAEQVSQEDKLTVIPVTEKSGSRTSGKEPHPLCDNIQYLAGDYKLYVSAEGKSRKGDENCHEAYMDALEAWHISEFTHPKVDAIFSYLQKGTLVKDLITWKVLILDENGRLDSKAKIQTAEQTKALVRFVVRTGETMDHQPEECWRDTSLQRSFIEYYRSQQKQKDLDYLTGEYMATSYLHSKKIRNEGDGSKLISSNDETYFTFRGRFDSKEQAFSIGAETSQKIHNALKWIIRKQGKTYDGMTVVCWESDQCNMPLWDTDTENIASGSPETADSEDVCEGGVENESQDEFAEDDFEEENEAFTVKRDTASMTVNLFYKALDGYRKQVDYTSQMFLIALDAATTGRLALMEYREVDATRYLKNIEKWHIEGSWLQTKFKNGAKKEYYGVPGIQDITECLYGIETGGYLSIPDKSGKHMYAQICKRLQPCIWDGNPLPYDLVRLAVERASEPQKYKSRYNWERILSLACSFVKKYRYEKYGKETAMVVEEGNKDRSYLYGRLLAVADRVEYRTYDRDKDGARVTNAKRYMSVFSKRPYDTWRNIEEKIQPYMQKLSVAERNYYTKELNKIMGMLSSEVFTKNTPLDGLYLLGFHHESYDLKNPNMAVEKKETTNGGHENE